MRYRWKTIEVDTLPALISQMEQYLGHAVNESAVNLALKKSVEIFGGFVSLVPAYWKHWPGDCLIEVSQNGEVKAHGRVQNLKGEVFKWYADKLMISRLVAQTYLDNPHDYPNVIHSDGNPRNNQLNNLEWYPNQIRYSYHLGDIEATSVAKLAKLTGHSENSIIYSYEQGTDLGVYRREKSD